MYLLGSFQILQTYNSAQSYNFTNQSCKSSNPGVVSVVYGTLLVITTFPCELSWFVLQHTAVSDHTLSLSAVALSMHTCQPWASAARWGRGLRTLSRTTQDGCFPSCSSISRPMIHFTDTWVIIGVCSSPLGMKLHERSQGGEWGWVVVGGRRKESEK